MRQIAANGSFLIPKNYLGLHAEEYRNSIEINEALAAATYM
jgi:hypothetical protein